MNALEALMMQRAKAAPAGKEWTAHDPDTLESIADEIDCHEHSARAASLRGMAKRARAALSRAQTERGMR